MREIESTPLSRWVDEVAAVVASLLVAAVGIAVLVRRYHRVLSQCIRSSHHPSDDPTDHPTDQQSGRPTDQPSGRPTDRPSDQLQDDAAVPNPFLHQPAPPSVGQVEIKMRDMSQHRVRHIVLQFPIFDHDEDSLFSV